MGGDPVPDWPGYKTVISSVSDKVDGVSSLGADSGGGILEVVVEVIDDG
jgi:hypothetical protein